MKNISERVVCIFIVLLVILVVATIMDLCFDKIYNEWIMIGIVAGLVCAVWQNGEIGFLMAVASMIVPIFLLYPLFMIGCLGAGDIKLLAVVGCFLTIEENVICLGISFLIGAVLSLLKMFAEHNFLQRMKYLLSYILDVFQSGEWKFYEEDIKERRKKKEGKIHFALPILLGVLVYKGGVHW